MQSAKEFADNFNSGNWPTRISKKYDLANLIRARDREIIEACKDKAAEYLKIKKLCIHEYSPCDCPDCQKEIKEFFDSVLLDLG